MHSKKPLLSDYQGNEQQLLQKLDEKLEQTKATIESIQKDIQLVMPLLDSYQGKEGEEAVLIRIDRQQQEVKQDFVFIENAWRKITAFSKSVKLPKAKPAENPTVEEQKPPKTKPTLQPPVPANSSSFAPSHPHFNLIPLVTDENLIKLNHALQAYHSSPSKITLNEIVEACNRYIESIPFERRSRRTKDEPWGKVLPEWPHIDSVLEMQKQAVSRLFLPEEKTDAKRRIKLFREIVGVENKSEYKGKLLDEKFWGEYKFKGKKYIQNWLKDSNFETSTYLRSYGEWVEFQNDQVDRDRAVVTYFEEAEKITFQNGLAFLRGKLLDQRREIAFVMGMDGEIYVSPENENSPDFHHSSFFSGNKVLCAGTLLVEKGKIQVMTNESGHYLPKRQHLANALEILQKKHALDLSKIVVRDISRADPNEEINALRFLKTKGVALSDAKYELAKTKPRPRAK
jgi:hypothetical protein